MHAEHHLFGVQPSGQLLHYAFANQQAVQAFPQSVNIWRLKRDFPAFKIFLDLWSSRSRPPMPSTPQGKVVYDVFAQLELGKPVQRDALQKATYLLLLLGAGIYLKKMQNRLAEFSSALTPNYREVLQRIDLSLPPRSELLLQACNPDLYVWIPPAPIRPSRLLVCFGTKTNSFNAPRPLAHYELARLGVGLLYVGNRTGHDPAKGLVGLTFDESVRQIQIIAEKLGFNRLYGLGTSLGGHTACCYAEKLNFERVLNFSGFSSGSEQDKTLGKNLATLNYPSDRILSVLSKSDPTDISILASYDRIGFNTPRAWVESATHGTFSAALIEGKLQHYFSWLLDDNLGNTLQN